MSSSCVIRFQFADQVQVILFFRPLEESSMIVALPILLLVLQTNPVTDPSATPAPTASTQTVPQPQNAQESSVLPVPRAGNSVLPPKLLSSVDPIFPKKARKHRFSGVATIGLIIDTQGHPTDVHVVKSIADTLNKKQRDTAPSLDQAAMDAVAQYRFAPAIEDGKPIPVKMNVQVNFQIF
jgi:TonB family protein